MKSLINDDIKAVRKIAKIVALGVKNLAEYEHNHDMFGYIDHATLAGYCGRASAMLSETFDKFGIEHEIVISNHHVYVSWNNMIVDLTAKQFNKHLGNVVFRTRESMIRQVGTGGYYNWMVLFTRANSDEFFKYQIDSDWPEEQTTKHSDFEFVRSLPEYNECLKGLKHD